MIQIEARISELKASADKLQSEIHTLTGKIANRAPAQAEAIQRQNIELRLHASSLEDSISSLLNQSLNATNAAELEKQTEILRKAAVEHCQQNNIDPELWKNLAY